MGPIIPSRAGHQKLRWFTDSPDAGDPRCSCSYCGERIEARPEGEDDFLEVNADEGEPVRMWVTGKNLELRFHPKCLEACLELGLLEYVKSA